MFLAGEATGLTEDKIRSLDRVGFCWTERDFRWYTMLERLKAFVEERRIEWTSQQKKEEEGQENDDHADANAHAHAHADDKLYRGEWFTISYDDPDNRDLLLWINVQRNEYSKFQSNLDTTPQQTMKKYSAITQRRIDALEAFDFPWKSSPRIKDETGPTVDDWSQLFDKMKEKGINPQARAKTHWFEGQSLNQNDDDPSRRRSKLYTEDELLKLWNSGEDDDED